MRPLVPDLVRTQHELDIPQHRLPQPPILHRCERPLVSLGQRRRQSLLLPQQAAPPRFRRMRRQRRLNIQPADHRQRSLQARALRTQRRDRFSDGLGPRSFRGRAALTLPIDPHVSASIAGFGTVFDNSIDAVSDRDFIAEFLSCAAITAIHISQLCETFVMWATSEFGFVTFADDVTTASSLMPNKKNPDPLEIARAKAGTISGDLINVLMVLKALPTGYNRDLQETKPPLVNTAKTLQATLQTVIKVLSSTKVNAGTMLQAASDPFVIATDLVEYLVNKGVPFRTAHEQIGELFAYCRESTVNPSKLPIAQLQKFAPQLESDALALFNAPASANAKTSHGGTGISQVSAQLANWTRLLG